MKKPRKILNIKDFAEKTGVSVATVSRVFSGKDKVAASTRERVLALAEEHGFRPNRAAGASFGAATLSVGVLLNSFGFYYARIAVGVQRELMRRGFLPIVLDMEASPVDALPRLLDHRIDGLVVTGVERPLSAAEMMELERFHVPVVRVNAGDDATCDFVGTDDEQGGRLVARHFLGLGHRRLAYCVSRPPDTMDQPRLKGFCSEARRSGVQISPEDQIVITATKSVDMELKAACVAMLSRPGRPSAVFAYNDDTALIVMEAAMELGLEIPGDLSLSGFGALPNSEYYQPPLTTVHQGPELVGASGARLILRRIENPDAPIESLRLPVSLVVRASTGKPRRNSTKQKE